MAHNITYFEGEPQDVSVFIGSMNFVATRAHPHFAEILQYLSNLEGGPEDPDHIQELFDVSVVIGQKFAPLSERVSTMNGHIFFDAQEVHDVVAETIVKFQQNSLDFMPLVFFMEKIATNPTNHSRENLFRWMQRFDFALFPDGDIVCYKGVNKQGSEFFSSSSGRAYVNGQLWTGVIPNQPGTVVEMPRDEVAHDPRHPCSVGLHVANWRFARNFASHTLLIKVNPRDVVSVPTDSSGEKMRVCRYRIVEPVSKPQDGMLFVGRLREATSRVSEQKIATVANAKPTKRKVKDADTPLPTTYERFKRADFERLPIDELKWLAKEWGVEVAWNADDGMSRTGRFAYKLDYAARGRRSRNAEATNKR